MEKTKRKKHSSKGKRQEKKSNSCKDKPKEKNSRRRRVAFWYQTILITFPSSDQRPRSFGQHQEWRLLAESDLLNMRRQSRSQRPQSFWLATGIATSGQVQLRKSAIHRLPVTLRMLRVKSDKSDWFWSRSIVFTKPFKTRMSLDLARGPDFYSACQKGPLGTRLMRREFVSYSQPIRFVKLDSEHAQSDGQSVNRGLPVLDLLRGRDYSVLLIKRSAASGDENGLDLTITQPNYTVLKTVVFKLLTKFPVFCHWIPFILSYCVCF